MFVFRLLHISIDLLFDIYVIAISDIAYFYRSSAGGVLPVFPALVRGI